MTRKVGHFAELVSGDAEEAFVRAGSEPRGSGRSHLAWDNIGRAVARLGLGRDFGVRGRTPSFVVLMGLAERQLYPFRRDETVFPLVYDCWPTKDNAWRSFFERNRFGAVFFTSRVAAHRWSEVLGDGAVWAPEAIAQAEYPPGLALDERETAVLEIGRPFLTVHRELAKALAPEQHSHPGSSHLLPTRGDLVAALHRSRALVCYPGSVSDPSGRTGSWEVMTHRYLEAVATKTLVIGRVPAEMLELFGFAPGISCEPHEIGEVAREIVADPSQYQGLVDKSYARLLEVGTWEFRVRQIMERAFAVA